METDDLIVMFMWIIIKRGDSQRNYPVTMVHIWWTKSSNRIDPRNHCAYHPRSGGTVERESGPVENNVYGTTSQGNCRYSPRKGNSTIHGLLSKTCLEFTKVVGIIPSPVDHSKVAKSATQTHASHCKRAPSPTTKVTSDPTPLSVTPTLKPGWSASNSPLHTQSRQNQAQKTVSGLGRDGARIDIIQNGCQPWTTIWWDW